MSLLQFILNSEAQVVYNENKNFDLTDQTVATSLRRASQMPWDQQTFAYNGIGFKAIILSYENDDLDNALLEGLSDPYQHPPDAPGDETAPPVGEVKKAIEFSGDDFEIAQALSQLTFLNNIKAKVWMPVVDTDKSIPVLSSKRLDDEGNLLQAYEGIELYSSCKVTDDSLLTRLPPPGSLVIVDYENRQTKVGLTMTSVICRDANFARSILHEFLDVPDNESHQETLAALQDRLNFAGNNLGMATGDPVGTTSGGLIYKSGADIKDHAKEFAKDLRRKLDSYGDTGKKITIYVTSGFRDARAQANAMIGIINKSGEAEFNRVYGKQKSSIRKAFLDSFKAQEQKSTASQATIKVVEDALTAGHPFSNHQSAGALDLRTNNLSNSQVKLLLKGFKDIGGSSYLLEPTSCWTGKSRKKFNCANEHLHVKMPDEYKEGMEETPDYNPDADAETS